MSKISHFMLNLIACWILEPKLESGRWIISETAARELQQALQKRIDVMKAAQLLFKEVAMCDGCSGSCCRGDFSRFTVYDHISHLLLEMEKAPEWGYKLRPFKSYEYNRSDEGSCDYYIENQGCNLDLAVRPSQCIWYSCSGIDKSFTNDQRLRLKKMRRDLDGVFWSYVRVLLFGGMRRIAPHSC